MASLALKNGAWYCQFYHESKRRYVTVGAVSRPEADRIVSEIERRLLRLRTHGERIPAGVPVTEFVFWTDIEVRAGAKEVPPPPPGVTVVIPSPSNHDGISFGAFRDRYLTAHKGVMEDNSLITAGIHLRHLESTFGPDFLVGTVTVADLQRHVERRKAKKYRGRPLSPATLKKDVTTFRAAWNWAVLQGLVEGTFPSRGVTYPKSDEKPPYRTLGEIERRLSKGGLTVAEVNDLWESLYLRREEVEELLTYIEGCEARPGWLHPLVSTAAYTGARRSELLRAEVDDVDLEAGTLLVREKKRSRKQRTTRTVTIPTRLKSVLRDWLADHPGGRFLFCQSGVVARSRKRGATTGHKSGAARPASFKGRSGSLSARSKVPVAPLTRNEVHDHFRRTLAGGRWEKVRGLHVLRHSYISTLAAAGVDQRIIDDQVGHLSDEQRNRYRHLIPDVNNLLQGCRKSL